MKKKHIKILLHHGTEQSVPARSFKNQGSKLVCWFYSVLNAIVYVSYTAGLFLLNLIKVPAKIFIALKNISFKPKPAKDIFGFILIVILLLTPVYGSRIIAEGYKLGGKVLGVSDSAIQSIEQAKLAIEAENYPTAQANFEEVLSHLQQAENQLNESSLALKTVTRVLPSGVNPDSYLRAGTLLAECAVIGSKLLTELNALTFTADGLRSSNKNSKDAIDTVLNLSQSFSEQLALAQQTLISINADILPAEAQIIVKDIQDFVAEAYLHSKHLTDFQSIAKNLLLGQKRFLVLLQNNNELRPTGGFIGTIGQGILNDGVIEKLDIRTVYDLDGQLLEIISPPKPLLVANQRLFLRDSNWFASFPESARLASTLYEKSGGETPDLVLAITPELFIQFLQLTGPINLPSYDIKISSQNFVEQIQTSTSLAYDKNLNQPKQLLADLFPVLMHKLGELSKREPLLLLKLFQQNLAKKEILIYSRNENLQAQLIKAGWAGNLGESKYDYLHINSANYSGTKTDRFLRKDAKLYVKINKDGSVQNKITYQVTNPLPKDSGLRNISWVRFYVPLGSELLGVSGLSTDGPPNLESLTNYAHHSQVKEWNDQNKSEPNMEIQQGQESNKSYFAGWITTEGGETKTVSLTYALPGKINRSLGVYKLLWNKQSGVNNLNTTIEIENNYGDWQWFNQNLNSNQKNLSWQGDLVKDMFFAGVLVK